MFLDEIYTVEQVVASIPKNATLLGFCGIKVLCERKGAYEPYVVWTLTPNGGVCWGHYFVELEDVVAFFKTKI